MAPSQRISSGHRRSVRRNTAFANSVVMAVATAMRSSSLSPLHATSPTSSLNFSCTTPGVLDMRVSGSPSSSLDSQRVASSASDAAAAPHTRIGLRDIGLWCRVVGHRITKISSQGAVDDDRDAGVPRRRAHDHARAHLRRARDEVWRHVRLQRVHGQPGLRSAEEPRHAQDDRETPRRRVARGAARLPGQLQALPGGYVPQPRYHTGRGARPLPSASRLGECDDERAGMGSREGVSTRRGL